MENQKNPWKVILGIFSFLVAAGAVFYGFLALVSGASLAVIGIFILLVGFFSTMGLRLFLRGWGLNFNTTKNKGSEEYSLKKIGLLFLVFYLLIFILRLLGLL